MSGCVALCGLFCRLSASSSSWCFLKIKEPCSQLSWYKIIFLDLTAALHSLARLSWTTFLGLFIWLVCVCMQYFLCWLTRSLLCHILLLYLVKPVELLAGPSCELNSWWSRRLPGGPKALIDHWTAQLLRQWYWWWCSGWTKMGMCKGWSRVDSRTWFELPHFSVFGLRSSIWVPQAKWSSSWARLLRWVLNT